MKKNYTALRASLSIYPIQPILSYPSYPTYPTYPAYPAYPILYYSMYDSLHRIIQYPQNRIYPASALKQPVPEEEEEVTAQPSSLTQ